MMTKTKTTTIKPKNKLRVGLVVPHIFLHKAVLPQVIFSPGRLALDLAAGLQALGIKVTLFSPGPADTDVPNSIADLSYFESELAGRGDTYIDLLKKHPFTFVTLARQVQSELIANAYTLANDGQFDLIHIYTNEEEIALPFAALCTQPVVFTHHDPFNFLVKYKSMMPKYKQLNWISMSLAQQRSMPNGTNWVGNVYHGLDSNRFAPNLLPHGNYVAYMGRIIEPKGVHLAIAAAKKAGVVLKIAGKHYAGYKKDTYWQQQIQPHIDGKNIEYVGFLDSDARRQEFLGNARALLVPSTFEEPFGMAAIEALACATPVIAFDSGALPEVIRDGHTGFIVAKQDGAGGLAWAIQNIPTIPRSACRADFEATHSYDYGFQTGVSLGRKKAKKYELLATTFNQVVPFQTFAMHYGASREANFSPMHDLNHYDTIHAEVALIIKTQKEKIDLRGTTLFINLLPCPTCARMFTQTDIAEFMYREDHSDGYGVNMLQKAGKKVTRMVR